MRGIGVFLYITGLVSNDPAVQVKTCLRTSVSQLTLNGDWGFFIHNRTSFWNDPAVQVKTCWRGGDLGARGALLVTFFIDKKVTMLRPAYPQPSAMVRLAKHNLLLQLTNRSSATKPRASKNSLWYYPHCPTSTSLSTSPGLLSRASSCMQTPGRAIHVLLVLRNQREKNHLE